MMSVSLQFNYFIQNKTAKAAIENYVTLLEKVFEQYRDLWEDHIKLKEEHEQCNVSFSSTQTTTDELCSMKDKIKLKSELLEKQLNSATILQESDMLELNSLQVDNLADISDDFFNSSPPHSPVFFKTYQKASTSAKEMQSCKAAPTCSKSSTSTKMFYNDKKISPNSSQKLEISTAYNVETTFLPSGKKLKQSRLMFHPVKHEKVENELIDITQKVKQDPVDTSVKVPIIVEDNASDESFLEDVTEISPTQNVQYKPKHCLQFKKNISSQLKELSSDKNVHDSFGSDSATKTIIDNLDSGFCSLPKYVSAGTMYDKSLANNSNTLNTIKRGVKVHNPLLVHSYSPDNKSTSSVNNQNKNQILNDKMQNTSKKLKINDPYEEETFYLPAEQVVNKDTTDIFNLDDSENEPPEKKSLLDKSHVLPKKKESVLEHLNTRCKVDRAKLNGWDCWECREYYKHLSLSKEDLQKRKNQCSRHRQKYERPRSPEGFWDPELPVTPSSTYRN